jgi:hypothetical protein
LVSGLWNVLLPLLVAVVILTRTQLLALALQPLLLLLPLLLWLLLPLLLLSLLTLMLSIVSVNSAGSAPAHVLCCGASARTK